MDKETLRGIAGFIALPLIVLLTPLWLILFMGYLIYIIIGK